MKNININLIALVILAFLIIYLLKKLGILNLIDVIKSNTGLGISGTSTPDTTENRERIEEWKSKFWNPETWKKYDNGLLPIGAVKGYTEDIKNAQNPFWFDNVELIFNTFYKLNKPQQISQLADQFEKDYKTSLKNFLQFVLNANEQLKLLKIVNSMS